MKKWKGKSGPWAQSKEELFAKFNTSEKGLKEVEVQSRLKRYGFNELKRNEKSRVWKILLSQFVNPLILVLIVASVIAFFLDEQTDAIIILLIVLVNGLLGFFQEYRAEKTLKSLRKLISQSARVMRDGRKLEIESRFLVPGDIVHLNIGDVIPADMRLIYVEGVTIDEASLTGESMPVLKTAKVIESGKNSPQYLKNMAFMGTHVMSGEGYGVVASTGEATFLGKTASYLSEKDEVSDFEKSISGFSNFLLKIILLMTLFIFIANTVLQHGLLESFLFALALAVGVTPEALPIIITIALSNGARALAKHKVVVKKLSSIEDLGNMDVLCTDKTGTLTEGKMSLEGFYSEDGKENKKVLIYGMLCNDAIVSGRKVEGNIIDKAILESNHAEKLFRESKDYKVLDHNEFDFNRRRMSVVIKAPDGKRYLVVKGAYESLQTVCKGAKKNKLVDKYRSQGYNTIHIAIKEWHCDKSDKSDEKDLELVGFLTFVDPPRETAKEAIRLITKMGVEIKVLSGDDPLVTEAICKKVGLEIKGDKIFTGDDLEKLNEREFTQIVNHYNVFSRISPDQKYKIVKVLNTGSQRTIAFMGDGVNDAPALKIADVGISVNTATNIAKEAADIILLQKSLMVVVNGIIEGRRIFVNINKYILNTVSANYGNMFTVAISSLFLKFIPLLPAQILLNNLLTDGPMFGIATDSVDEGSLLKPNKLDTKMIRSFMVFFGLLSTFFDLSLILTLLFVLKAEPAVFRTAWFFESAISEIVVMFAIRTRGAFFKSKPGKFLSLASVFVIVAIFVLIYTPLGAVFDFVALKWNYILLSCGIIVTYFFAAELIKKFFFKKYAEVAVQ